MYNKKEKKTEQMSDFELDKAIKIQGTEFDRKRKLTDESIKRMRLLYNQGYTIISLAEMFNTSYLTVKYNVDDDFKSLYNATRSGAHTGITKLDFTNRVMYKRDLVLNNKIKALGI